MQALDEQGVESVGSTTQEFAMVIGQEFAPNRKLTASMGIVPQQKGKTRWSWDQEAGRLLDFVLPSRFSRTDALSR